MTFKTAEQPTVVGKKSAVSIKLMYSQQCAKLIHELGLRNKTQTFNPQSIVNTAVIYMHNFYAKMSPQNFKTVYVAMSCFYLACKVKDNPCKVQSVINQMYAVLKLPSPTKTQHIRQLVQRIHSVEGILVMVVGFPVIFTDQPQERLFAVLQELEPAPGLNQVCFFVVNNLLHLTNLCTRYTTNVIAAASLYIASKWHKVRLPSKMAQTGDLPWFYLFGKDVRQEDLRHIAEEFVAVFRSSPLQLREKLKEFRKKHPRDHNIDAFQSETNGKPADPFTDLDTSYPDKRASRSRSVTPLRRGSHPSTPTEEEHYETNTTPNGTANTSTVLKPRLSLADYQRRKQTTTATDCTTPVKAEIANPGSSSNLHKSESQSHNTERHRVPEMPLQSRPQTNSSLPSLHKPSSQGSQRPNSESSHNNEKGIHPMKYSKNPSPSSKYLDTKNIKEVHREKRPDLDALLAGDKRPHSGMVVSGDRRPPPAVASSGDKRPHPSVASSGEKRPHSTMTSGEKRPPSSNASGEKRPPSTVSGEKRSHSSMPLAVEKKSSSGVAVSGERRPHPGMTIAGEKRPHSGIMSSGAKRPHPEMSSSGEKRIRPDQPSLSRSSSSSGLVKSSSSSTLQTSPVRNPAQFSKPKIEVSSRPPSLEPSDAYDPADDLHDLF